MKDKEIFTERLSRRGFLGAAAAATAASVIPFSTSYGSTQSSAPGKGIPNSKFSGVQVGAITYSFRDLTGGLEAVLKACVDAGLSSVELMGTGVEDYLGAPK
ncbi:MAG: twin-arginine translocation signal domain-containing protein, partial [Petrimonas sp.]|nr:twin-arginine translocation signal domain-containing protein [Petrimonas sp.]